MSDLIDDPGRSAPRSGERSSEDVLYVLPLRDVTVFPGAVVPLRIVRPALVEVAEQCLRQDTPVALLAQLDPAEDAPSSDGLHSRGCRGRILKLQSATDGSARILVEGERRVETIDFPEITPHLRARIDLLDDVVGDASELDAIRSHVVTTFGRLVEKSSHLTTELLDVISATTDPAKVADLIASNLTITQDEKQGLLASLDVRDRLITLTSILSRELRAGETRPKKTAGGQPSKSQQEYYLRKQLRDIERELGEADPREAEIDNLRKRIDAASPTAEARRTADQELHRLRLIPIESSEHSVVRTYLEWIADLPWAKSTADNLDIPHARQILDEDHYALDHVKDRVLEFLAVRRLKRSPRGPILCFVGPPGTGKTSLGKSIARAIGRKFIRVSLGGIRDESEIRGHRRTYVGALPGRILQNIKKVGSNNPVLMFDEIDKIGSDFRGDPASALLEVLDPEQNDTFQDHYLDIGFDLSKVMFIATANQLEPIPAALRDRMEIIDLPGYSDLEKLEIADRHLIPKQLDENGLAFDQIAFPREGLLHLIHRYTREAGLRNMEREIGALCRKVARSITEGRNDIVVASPEIISAMLGPEKIFPEVAEAGPLPGVATGLVRTPMGGDIVFVEATSMRGNNRFLVTGNLGDVMKESAQAAFSHIRARADKLGISPETFENIDIHVHVPAGAVPKDGPSAGVAIAVALTSLFSGFPARAGVAMTGEITLRGRVLPVGGLKEKILGAKRAGIHTILLPARNASDLNEIPEHVRETLTFHLVQTVDEVLDLAIDTTTTETTTTIAEHRETARDLP